jgi:hypothetical protein
VAVPSLTSNSGGTSSTSSVTSFATTVTQSGASVGACVCMFVASDGNPTISADATSIANGWAKVGQWSQGTACTLALFKFMVMTANTVPGLTLTISVAENLFCYQETINPSGGGFQVEMLTPPSAVGNTTSNPNPPSASNGSGATRDIRWVAAYAGDTGTVVTSAYPSGYTGLGHGTSGGNAANGCTMSLAHKSATGVTNGSSEDPGTFTRNAEDWIAQTFGYYEIASTWSLVMNNAVSGSSAEAPVLAPKTQLAPANATSAELEDNVTITANAIALVVATARSRGQSYGIGYSPNLLANGTFDTDSNWTKGTGWTISGGVAVADAGGATGNLSQGLTLADYQWVELYFDVVTRTAGLIEPFLSLDGPLPNRDLGSGYVTTGTKYINITPTYDDVINLTFDDIDALLFDASAFAGSIDNVILRYYNMLDLSTIPNYDLALDNVATGSTLSNITLGAESPLNMEDVVCGTLMDNIVLVPKTALTVQNADSWVHTRGIFGTGPNLIPDSGFDDPSKWTLTGTGLSISGSKLIGVNSDGVATPNPPLEVPVPTLRGNPLYKAELSISSHSDGNAIVRHGTSVALHHQWIGSTFSQDYSPRTVLAGEGINVGTANSFDGQLDNVKFYEMYTLNLSPKTSIVVAGLVSAQLVDALAIGPKTPLVVAGGTSASLVDNITLAAKTALTVANETSASLASAVTLVPKTALSVANASSAELADNVVLAPKTSLVVAGGVSASLATSPAVGTLFTITPANMSSVGIATNLTLTSKYILTLANGVSLSTLEPSPLTLKYTLTPANMVCTSIASAVVLTSYYSLTMQNAISPSDSTNIQFTGINVQNANSASTTTSPLLGLSLLVANGVSAGILENISLTPRWILTADNMVCAETIENITMSPEYMLLQMQAAISEGISTTLNLVGIWEVLVADMFSAQVVTQPIPGVSIDLEDAVSPSLGSNITFSGVKSVMNPANLRSQSQTTSPNPSQTFSNYLKAPLTNTGAYNITNPGTLILQGDFYIDAYAP